jgi:hypothetical protein
MLIIAKNRAAIQLLWSKWKFNLIECVIQSLLSEFFFLCDWDVVNKSDGLAGISV